MFQTEYNFTLPKGYVDDDGNLHKNGIMRLATAADEILPLRDPRVKENPAYLSIIRLSRVITKLGTIDSGSITPGVVEKLFASDLAYLQEFYSQVNGDGVPKIKTKCSECGHKFEVDIGSGE